MGDGRNRIKSSTSIPPELLKPPIIRQSGGRGDGGSGDGGVVGVGVKSQLQLQ